MDIQDTIQVVLIILKCFDLITWSWPAVFTPLWITLFIATIGLIVT